MSITICESGLKFGEYANDSVFHAECSSVYQSLGENVCTVEFILKKQADEFLLVEAKSGSPQPSNQEDFDKFIQRVYVKFAHAIDLFFSLVTKRLQDESNEMPVCFKEADFSVAKVKLVLVINGHKIGWLSPINEALKRKMKRQIKTWNLEVVVMNHELADEYNLLKH